jgi:hypothetical protein
MRLAKGAALKDRHVTTFLPGHDSRWSRARLPEIRVDYSGQLIREEDSADRGDHLGPLRAYFGAHYHVVKTFENGEQIWERQEAER